MWNPADLYPNNVAIDPNFSLNIVCKMYYILLCSMSTNFTWFNFIVRFGRKSLLPRILFQSCYSTLLPKFYTPTRVKCHIYYTVNISPRFSKYASFPTGMPPYIFCHIVYNITASQPSFRSHRSSFKSSITFTVPSFSIYATRTFVTQEYYYHSPPSYPKTSSSCAFWLVVNSLPRL